MRVGLFGGSFDPPHRGHMAVASAAADAFKLDVVLFAPVGLQPLKAGSEASPYADRLAMVELACAADARFRASRVDAPRASGRPNFTVDTLERLRAEWPEARLFNIVGADSFLGLAKWKEPERLLELVEWIVVSRPGFSVGDVGLTEEQRARVHRIEGVCEDVAATELRRRLEARDPCVELLDPAVAGYIAEKGLYR